MKRTIIWIGTVIGAAAVVSLVMNAFMTGGKSRTISTSGQCITSVPKDRVAITLRVSALDKDAALSMHLATAQAKEITTYLKNKNVKMQTTEFDSYEKTQWDNIAQKSVVLGTETTISIEVSAEKMESIEEVLTKFAGRENIYPEKLRMYTSAAAMKPALESCLSSATKNARLRADALARGDKARAGKMLAVSYDSDTASQYQPIASNFLRATAAGAENAAIDAGGTMASKDTTVSVQVQATFEIK